MIQQAPPVYLPPRDCSYGLLVLPYLRSSLPPGFGTVLGTLGPPRLARGPRGLCTHETKRVQVTAVSSNSYSLSHSLVLGLLFLVLAVLGRPQTLTGPEQKLGGNTNHFLDQAALHGLLARKMFAVGGGTLCLGPSFLSPPLILKSTLSLHVVSLLSW